MEGLMAMMDAPRAIMLGLIAARDAFIERVWRPCWSALWD